MKVNQKCSFPNALRIHVAEHFREPVVPAGENAEHRTERKHIVEVRDDVVGVLQHAVDTSVGQNDAGDAAERKEEMKRIAHSIGVLNSIEPPHIVAIHEKIFTPVGTAITMVAATK